MCWEGRRRLRGASLRIATTPAALSFVLLLSMRLDRSPTCSRPRICRRRRAWSGCGLRLSLVLWGVRRNARRIAGRGQSDLGPVAQPVGAVDDNLVSGLKPIEDRDMLAVAGAELHLLNGGGLVRLDHKDKGTGSAVLDRSSRHDIGVL